MTDIAFESTAAGTAPVHSPAVNPARFVGTLESRWLSSPAYLRKFRTVLGRRNADIVLEDLDVSRQHAAIENYGERYLLRDLGSTNGTFVNGRRVEVELLNPGDIIRAGNCQLVFAIELD